MSIRPYFTRPTTLVNLDDYDDPVVGSEINQDVDVFKFLFQDCFSHHLIEELCGDTDNLHPDLGDSKRIIDSDNLDAYFLRRKGRVPKLSATANSDMNDIVGNGKTFQQFVKAITDPPLRTVIPENATSVGENRVTYLVGDAGMGKTFTVLKLIDELRTRTVDYRGYKPIPIYVDLHQGSNRLHPTHHIGPEFFRNLLNKVVDVAVSNAILKRENFPLPSEEVALDSFFRNLAIQLARSKYFLIFVFDNTDRFYFDNAKYAFFPQHTAKRDESIDQNLLTLIRKFVEETELGKIGASILFVCRKYVFNHCRQLQDAANRTRPILAKHSVFQLIPISENELIESRFELLRDAVASISKKAQTSGKATQYSKQLIELEESLRIGGHGRDTRTLALIHRLVKLSSRGEVLIAGLDGKDTEPLCFDFDYLQLVTDDFWLAFPTPWINEIYVDATIGHTLKNIREYGRRTEATLAKKVPAVLYFS